jgi:hypothetical protein
MGGVKLKVHELTIIDKQGQTVLELDGTYPGGMRGVNNRLSRDEEHINWPLLAGSLNSFIWVCTRGIWQISSVATAITVSGGASATVQLVHCAGGVALASGTDQLTAIDVQETGPDVTVGALIASPNNFYPGDVLGVVFAGTLIGLVGVLTVAMKRVG